MRSRIGFFAIAALAALLAATASLRAEPVKIRVGWVVVPGQLTPIIFDPPGVVMLRDFGFIKTSIDVRKYSDLSLVEEAARRLK